TSGSSESPGLMPSYRATPLAGSRREGRRWASAARCQRHRLVDDDFLRFESVLLQSPAPRGHSRWAVSSSGVAVLIDATTAEHARGIRTVILGVLSELPHVTQEGTIVAAGRSLPSVEGLSIRRV